MKQLFILFILLPTIPNLGKRSNELSVVRKQTKSIMNTLGIPIRKYIQNENEIKLTSYPSKNVTGRFVYDKIMENPEEKERYFTKPSLAVSNKVFECFSSKKGNPVELSDAFRTIVHELTHYYQTSFSPSNYILPTASDQKSYLKQQCELEAHAVDAYYYLYYYQRKKLTDIMSKKLTKEDRLKLLYNTFAKLRYPNQPERLI